MGRRFTALVFLAGCATPPPPIVPPTPPSLEERGIAWNGVSTRLRLLDLRPSLGGPIRVALDLVNDREGMILYDELGCGGFDAFDILGADGRRLSHIARMERTFSRPRLLNPRQSVTLTVELDLSCKYLLREPGRYHLRFKGPFASLGYFDDSGYLIQHRRGYLEEPENLRSDWIKVEVGPGHPPPSVEVVHRLRLVAPAGWEVVSTGRIAYVSHPDADSWDKTLEVQFGPGVPEAGASSLGHSPWGKIYLFSSWSGMAVAWPDYIAKVRAVLAAP